MRNRRQSGFTLVEMMIALAVMLMIAGIGIPGIQEMLRAFQLRAALSSYSSDFAMARISAIGHRHPVVVCPTRDGRNCRADSDWQSGWIVFTDANGDLSPDGAESILQVHEALPEGIVAVSNRGRRYLRYLPDGSSAGSNLTLQLCQQQKTRARVVVNNAGRVRIERLPKPLACPVS